MAKKVYKIVCEWDIDENELFTSKKVALKAIHENQSLKEILADDRSESIESLMEDGYLSIQEVSVK